MRRTLVEKQVVSKDDWLQIMTDVKEAKSTLQSTLAQLRDIQAARDILQIALLKTRHDFISENLKNIGQVERQSNSLREQVNQREAQLALMTFKSPINGTIVASSLVSQGQVVTPGEELMRVVPDNSRLEIIAYVPNQDIGFIRPGQPVDVKINAFPYTRYGTLNGVVQHISQDAIPAADAQQVQMDPTRLGSNTKAGGGQSTQGLVFPLTVALEQDHILVGNQQVSLVSGMGVSVEIKTDRRRLIDYLVSPIYDLTSSSLRER
nr:HlyD family type I secretion periplasmic adaptor subunit [Edwardsiella ictaluri]